LYRVMWDSTPQGQKIEQGEEENVVLQRVGAARNKGGGCTLGRGTYKAGDLRKERDREKAVKPQGGFPGLKKLGGSMFRLKGEK